MTDPADTATARVKAALSAGEQPTVRDFEHALRELGFSSRAARRITSAGYRGQCSADADELNAALERIAAALRATM